MKVKNKTPKLTDVLHHAEQQKMILAMAHSALHLMFEVQRNEFTPPHKPGSRINTNSTVVMKDMKRTVVPVSIRQRIQVMAKVGGLPNPVDKKKFEEFWYACNWLDGVTGKKNLNAQMSLDFILPRFSSLMLKLVEEDIRFMDHTGFWLSDNSDFVLK